MLYALVMLITINGQHHSYIIDHGLTLGDCYTALTKTKPNFTNTQNVKISQTFQCERKAS